MGKETNNKVLDISQFIIDTKRILEAQPIVSVGQSPYYGKISIYFEEGHVNHIERFETIK
jgi:hypothetical protein